MIGLFADISGMDREGLKLRSALVGVRVVCCAVDACYHWLFIVMHRIERENGVHKRLLHSGGHTRVVMYDVLIYAYSIK